MKIEDCTTLKQLGNAIKQAFENKFLVNVHKNKGLNEFRPWGEHIFDNPNRKRPSAEDFCQSAYLKVLSLAGDKAGSLPAFVLDHPEQTLIELLKWIAEKAEQLATREPSAAGQNEGTGEKENKGTQSPTPAETRAWQSYCWVIEKKPALVIPETGKDYLLEMYDAAIGESGSYQDPEGVTIARPSFDSWKRNVRGYKQKAPSRPEVSDTLRSAIKSAEIQNLSEITSEFETEAD